MILNKLQTKNGFTLIELLVVVAIAIMISGLGLVINLDFYKIYALNLERDIVINIFIKARNRATSNFNESRYGIYINFDGYTVFQGSSYASRNQTYDELIKRSRSITSSGLQEIVFEQLTGNLTTNTGDVILSNNAKSINISLNSEGRIN